MRLRLRLRLRERGVAGLFAGSNKSAECAAGGGPAVSFRLLATR